MIRKLIASTALLSCLVGVAACDDGGGGDGTEPGDQLPADPGYFAAQRFDCDPATGDVPSCPPGTCDVDAAGNVGNCVPSCNVDQTLQGCTAFQGPEGGIDLCVPTSCTVSDEGAAPICDERCSDDDVTCYVFEFPQCGD